MVKPPPHLDPRLRHLPIYPPKRPSSQHLFERAARLKRLFDPTSRTHPSLGEDVYWRPQGSTSQPSLLGEGREVTHAVKSAIHDVQSGVHKVDEALLNGPFRTVEEAVLDATKLIENQYVGKLLRAMGKISSGGGGGNDTQDTTDEAVDFFGINK
jgi:hypothetical protein